MQMDNEVYSQEGNSYDFGARQYDARIGRWMSTDASEAKYPYASPYNYVLNTPLSAIDPDGKDVYLIVWATNSNTGYGHAAIAVTNYKTVSYNTVVNGQAVTQTKKVPDGTFTYYDLWPGKDTDGDGVGDDFGSAGPKDAFTGPIAYYQVKDKLERTKQFNQSNAFKKGDAITENMIINGDVSEGEGRAPDGVIKLNAGYDEDMETIADLKYLMKSHKKYTSLTNNCSDLAVNGVAESLDTYETIIEFFADESYWLSYTTPNGLYKYVKNVITKDPKEGKELKNPGTLVDAKFEDVVIKPQKQQQP